MRIIQQPVFESLIAPEAWLQGLPKFWREQVPLTADWPIFWQALLPASRVDFSSVSDWRAWYAALFSAMHRQVLGQYFTPDSLCNLMLALTIRKPTDSLLDAGCGTGAFLLSARHLLTQHHGRTTTEALGQLAGVELDFRAAALCAQLLYTGNRAQNGISAPGTLPRIWPGDFLAPLPGDFSGFDAIIGNPPYVRHEHLAQSTAFRPEKSQVLLSLQEAFADYLSAFPAQRILFSRTADLYLWFFLRATLLLKPGGRLTFVTSNSWLNTVLGNAFIQFLNAHFHIRLVMESACESWFPEAAINPLVLVLERKASGYDTSSQESVRLLRLKRPLRDWLPEPSQAGWMETLNVVSELTHPDAADSPALRRIATLQDIPQTTLCRSQDMVGKTSWAFHLRAPLEVQRLVEPPFDGRWVDLQTLGQVRYPLKTGINRFFYLSAERAAEFGIEPEFLSPVIKSSREIEGLQVEARHCKQLLFSCPYTPDELERGHKPGALRYIRWGETQVSQPRQKRAQPVPWPQVSSVRQRAHWYQLKTLPPGDLLCSRFFDRRFFFAECAGPIVEDQTFYGVTLFPQYRAEKRLILALLNSTLCYLLLELHGRSNLGEGVLQYAKQDMAAFPVLDPGQLPARQKAEILQAFEPLYQRPVLPIEQEVRQPDRRALDTLIFSLFSPNPEDLRLLAVEALLGRVRERTELAASRKNCQ